MREVRLIGENGEQLGVLPTVEALQIARDRGVDLVEVAPTAVPPVCRLLDYGRFKYEQEKKEREARKNQRTVLMKEIRLRPKTDEHDLDFKSRTIQRFIEDGDKVKVTLRFRGRELAHPNLGRQLLEEVAERVKEVAMVERMPLMEGNTMTMILSRAKPGGAPATARPASAEAPSPVAGGMGAPAAAGASPPAPGGAPPAVVAVPPPAGAPPATPSDGPSAGAPRPAPRPAPRAAAAASAPRPSSARPTEAPPAAPAAGAPNQPTAETPTSGAPKRPAPAPGRTRP